MALPLNIDDLIHQRKVESARIEYKKDWNPEKVLHSVCAMRENGSPDPQFYNPETRSFMTVILPIHEAFKTDEPPVEAETVAMTGEKSVEKGVEKSVEKIIRHLSQNPFATQNELAVVVGLSVRGVEKNLKILKASGRLRRVGPDKGGHWEVVK